MRWTKNVLVLTLALLIAVAPALFAVKKVSAAPLLTRKVTIGSSEEGKVTTHNYSFTIQTASTLGSIEFEYCSNNPFVGTSCTAPSGLDASTASLTSQTGETGFSIHASSTANRLLISRVPSANLAFQPATYNFSNITNPDISNPTTYVRLSTFASDDGTGPRTDSGPVAFSVAQQLSVQGFVPPYLTFCVGITISNKCGSVSGSFIDLGELSKTKANYSTSQFGGATNDPGGYSVFLSGTTMTSGTNVIPSLTTQTASAPGTSQFGINLKANSNPAVGQNVFGGGTAVALSGYNTSNKFKFKNEPIAASPISTSFNTLTVSYLVNVSNNQRPGVYTTTVTYIATAAF